MLDDGWLDRRVREICARADHLAQDVDVHRRILYADRMATTASAVAVATTMILGCTLLVLLFLD